MKKPKKMQYPFWIITDCETGTKREYSLRDAGCELATIPYNLELTRNRRTGVYTLRQEGRFITRWREQDAKGLAGWLVNFLHFFIALREAAVVESGVTKKRVRGGATGGKVTAAKLAPHHDLIKQLARGCIARGEDPLDSCEKWADSYHYSNVDSVKRIVRQVLRE